MQTDFYNIYKWFSLIIIPFMAFTIFDLAKDRLNIGNMLYAYSSPEISEIKLVVNNSFIGLIEDQISVNNVPNAKEFFNDLGLKLVGIVAIENNDNQGFVMLESNNENKTKKMYRSGDIIAENVFLNKIKKNKIELKYENEIYLLSISDSNNVTAATGVVALDVSLIEILPYLKAESGVVNGMQGVFLSDIVNGKVLGKLNLKQNDFLFNLSGNNVFNLSSLNDAYIALKDRKDIVATLYRNGELKKIVARRVNN